MLIPFHISIDPMHKLLLVNFTNDPDSIYTGFEPQAFLDDSNEEKYLVIGWRKDGKVDVYHDESLNPDPDKYDIAGKGLSHMIKMVFDDAIFELREQGVYARFNFQDIQQRKISIVIEEKKHSDRKPFGLLAPMGSAAEKPSSLPMIMLHDFYFVRKKHTNFEITIEGKKHCPDSLPLPMDFKSMYFTRYSTLPLIATLNPAYKGHLNITDTEYPPCEYTYEFAEQNGQKSLRALVRKNSIHPVKLSFSNPFPDIMALPDESYYSSFFEITAHPSVGKIAGHCKLQKRNNNIQIEMIPDKGWIPVADKLSLKFLYKVASVFKKWPATYCWKAEINLNLPEVFMKSEWIRFDS
jgi:hypothetical protein